MISAIRFLFFFLSSCQYCIAKCTFGLLPCFSRKILTYSSLLGIVIQMLQNYKRRIEVNMPILCLNEQLAHSQRRSYKASPTNYDHEQEYMPLAEKSLFSLAFFLLHRIICPSSLLFYPGSFRYLINCPCCEFSPALNMLASSSGFCAAPTATTITTKPPARPPFAGGTFRGERW